MSQQQLTQTLVESFNALADEVQALTDRKTILEHKLRYAHEQFQAVADKHVSADSSISETLANLQLPPDTHSALLTDAVRVPLPPRGRPQQDSRHKTALIIRDGRRASQQLAALVEAGKASSPRRDVFSRASQSRSSMPTALEQDFTVEGKKGSLACPFSRGPSGPTPTNKSGDMAAADPTPHHSADPICAAMFEEATHMPPPAADADVPKCPIRYMDEHSPEEIAHYVETHKHELPRSHEICVARYQRNEEEIRKLDAKYGNIVSMIQVLSQLHKPMLPSAVEGGDDRRRNRDLDRASNKRVESWAQEVSASAPRMDVDKEETPDEGNERAGRFDRPLKEIRVGESPTRPWGISVPPPYNGDVSGPPLSPPPAPVVQDAPRKCPFSQGKMASGGEAKCPFGGTAPESATRVAPSQGSMPASPPPQTTFEAGPPLNKPFVEPMFINVGQPPAPQQAQQSQQQSQHTQQAQQQAPQNGAQNGVGNQGGVQMIFTGPVFIGYSVEQAMQILSQWRR